MAGGPGRPGGPWVVTLLGLLGILGFRQRKGSLGLAARTLGPLMLVVGVQSLGCTTGEVDDSVSIEDDGGDGEGGSGAGGSSGKPEANGAPRALVSAEDGQRTLGIGI